MDTTQISINRIMDRMRYDRNLLYVFLLCLILQSPIVLAGDGNDFETRADQLDALGLSHDFIIDGLDYTEAYPPKRSRGSIQRQLRRLLSEFNYLMTASREGRVQRIVITGIKQDTPANTIIDTHKQGRNHTILASIMGPSQNPQTVTLLIDTGADYVVLPESMLTVLGIDPESLTPKTLQTANGQTRGQIGRLDKLEIGDESVYDVAVAFLPDQQLGDTRLLGMNVLGNYRITLDDAARTITLVKIR